MTNYKHYIIAEIDTNGICIGITESYTTPNITKPTLIDVTNTIGFNALGKRYENGEWVEVPQPETQPARPSFEERMTELEEVINELLNA